MSIINVLLFCLLIINSYSILDKDFFFYDYYTCLDQGRSDIEACTRVNSTLEYKEEYGSHCCILTYKRDPASSFKTEYGANWKEIFKSIFQIPDDNVLDEMLNELRGNMKEGSSCRLFTKNLKNYFLYDYSFDAINGTIKYDCGDGEQTFTSKDYIPIEENDKLYKDIVDCNQVSDEKNCFKRASKLYSVKSQCCWCEKSSLENDYLLERHICKGFSINEIDQEIKRYMNTSMKIFNQTYTMACTCLNKEGKSVKALANSVTGQIILE